MKFHPVLCPGSLHLRWYCYYSALSPWLSDFSTCTSSTIVRKSTKNLRMSSSTLLLYYAFLSIQLTPSLCLSTITAPWIGFFQFTLAPTVTFPLECARVTCSPNSASSSSACGLFSLSRPSYTQICFMFQRNLKAKKNFQPWIKLTKKAVVN